MLFRVYTPTKGYGCIRSPYCPPLYIIFCQGGKETVDSVNSYVFTVYPPYHTCVQRGDSMDFEYMTYPSGPLFHRFLPLPQPPGLCPALCLAPGPLYFRAPGGPFDWAGGLPPLVVPGKQLPRATGSLLHRRSWKCEFLAPCTGRR